MSHFRRCCSIVLIVFISMTSLASAEEQQSWSVQFENETTILRATPKTPTKYIQAAIEALKAEGVEKFVLKAHKAKEFNQLQNVAMIVKVVDQDAELLIAPDLTHKYVISTIKHLNEVGINEVKLTLQEVEETPTTE